MGSASVFEIVFDIIYLILIWILVVLMFKKTKYVTAINQKVANALKFGFLFLALGDTGHVGFRVWAYALGGLETKINLFGLEIPLVGVGALCTAYTITILYMLIINAWKIRFNRKSDFIYYFLEGVGILRLIIMLFPQNQWEQVTPPYTWSLIRNTPLMIMGICIAILILISAYKANDKQFKTFGWLIVASYAFYTPVIVLRGVSPYLGMLMIPKTIAYILMAYFTYKYFFNIKGKELI